MLADKKKYWEQRISALNEVIQETLEMVDVQELMEEIKQYPVQAGALAENRQILLDALKHEAAVLEATSQGLEDMRQFAGAALNFFLGGFYDKPRRLKRSEQYPPQMVLHTLLSELSTDLEIFQRSLQQRRLVGGKVSKHLFVLSVGDRVAAAALRPAFEAKFLKEAAVATHLGNDFDIRLIPYDPMLVIEMPFTTGSILAEKRIQPLPTHEHLALLHEVGHHVYHHGIAQGTGLTFESYLTQELFQAGITGGLANWLEELFADIYGLLVGGPVMVLSYQERLSQENPEALRVDTGDHPISILRPLIQSQVLSMITGGSARGYTLYRNAPELLDRNWLEFLGGKDPKDEVFLPLGVSHPISGGTIVKGLAPIIQKILYALTPLQSIAATGAWSKDLEPGQELTVLSEQLQQGSFLGTAAAAENLDGGKGSALVESYQKMAGRDLSEAEWWPLFDFVGWSTEFSVGVMPSFGFSPLRVGDMPS